MSLHPLFHILALASLVGYISSQDLNLSAVSLKDVIYQGPACQAGSLETIDFTNPTRFDLQFIPYIASIGANITAYEARKLCIIHLTLNYPATLQYGTISMTYTGAMHLDRGFNAQISTKWYFGSVNESDITTTTLIQGPYDGDLTLTQEVNNQTRPGDEIIWSNCGDWPSVLHIQSQIRILNVTRGGMGSDGSGWVEEDGKFGVRLGWRGCDRL